MSFSRFDLPPQGSGNVSFLIQQCESLIVLKKDRDRRETKQVTLRRPTGAIDVKRFNVSTFLSNPENVQRVERWMREGRLGFIDRRGTVNFRPDVAVQIGTEGRLRVLTRAKPTTPKTLTPAPKETPTPAPGSPSSASSSSSPTSAPAESRDTEETVEEELTVQVESTAYETYQQGLNILLERAQHQGQKETEKQEKEAVSDRRHMTLHTAQKQTTGAPRAEPVARKSSEATKSQRNALAAREAEEQAIFAGRKKKRKQAEQKREDQQLKEDIKETDIKRTTLSHETQKADVNKIQIKKDQQKGIP